jgi:hypothetical protein
MRQTTTPRVTNSNRELSTANTLTAIIAAGSSQGDDLRGQLSDDTSEHRPTLVASVSGGAKHMRRGEVVLTFSS